MTLALLHHSDCELHSMGNRHPERPERLAAISERLKTAGFQDSLRDVEPAEVEREQLLAVHDADYIAAVEAQSPEQGMVQLDPDTAMNNHTLRAARLAAGAAVRAVDLVLEGAVERAFCAVRPPGHHAERGRAMGFCIFNNVAVAAYHALNSHGLERVAIVDFDVHHGNGTEHIVAGDERILFCSTFQHPFYPYSGADCPASNVLNTPLLQGTDGPAFREVIEKQWIPALNQFQPQLIIVSAGFDAHSADRMAGLELLEDDYRWVTAQLLKIAHEHAEGHVISCLEGGYELNSLAGSVTAHLQELL